MVEDNLDAFSRHLGLEIRELGPSRVLAVWSAKPELHQPHGILHGGVHCSVVEIIASLGAEAWMDGEGQVVGVHNATDFFAAVRTGTLTSIGTPVQQGRSQQVWSVETTTSSGRLVAKGQVRLQNVYRRINSKVENQLTG